jgi:ferredoxin
MRVTIDASRCQGHGRCYDAAASCPERAITIGE